MSTNNPDEIHYFIINPDDNGGESLSLKTKYYLDRKYREVTYNQELTLQSYCNSATFTLCGVVLTPEILRKLADELEFEIRKLRNKC